MIGQLVAAASAAALKATGTCSGSRCQRFEISFACWCNRSIAPSLWSLRCGRDYGEIMGGWVETLGDLNVKQVAHDSVVLDSRRSVTAQSKPTTGVIHDRRARDDVDLPG